MKIMNLKNKSKLSQRLLSLSLVLALCLSLSVSAFAASSEIDADGGEGTSSVTLYTTDDGTLSGNAAATAMSVTVPTVLPVAVGTDGTVTTATNAQITNNSYGAVKITSVSIETEGDWVLTAFGDKSTLASEKVDSNQFGFELVLGGALTLDTSEASGSSLYSQDLLSAAASGCYMSGVGDTDNNYVSIEYDAIVTPVSTAVTNSTIGSVIFIVEWDT